MADIFLSYAREDEARARALAGAFEARSWSVFWDRHIPHGRDFRTHIQQQLDSARCIVVLWSSGSVKSHFVLDEATEGQNDGRLVPALIEAVRQPLGFRGLQAANLADWTGAETSHDEFERLVSSIAEIVPPSVRAVHSTSVAHVAASTRPEVEGNAKPTADGTDLRPWLPDFVEIPAGPFTMGSDKSKDSQAHDIEMPQHQVTLPVFFIGRDAVTVGQFKACAGEGGCKPSDGSSLTGPDDLPVRNVSWHEAIAYCAWLETKLKALRATPADLAAALAGPRGGGAWHVTLPSEAEWEKAARGTDCRIYPWGDRIDPTKANYEEATRSGPTAGGSFPGGNSPYGVRDMSGNVWEWTRSHYKPYPYRPDDGRENLTAGDDVLRVVRGGCFLIAGEFVRAARRYWSGPNFRVDRIGFRVVMSPFQP